MRIVLFFSVLGLLPAEVSVAQSAKLWYNQPARNWNEALPTGNGRLGVMMFGSVDEELLQLNESSLWSGGPAKLNPNPASPAYLPQVRQAVADERYEDATTLTRNMQGLYTESYEPLGDLRIRHSFTGKPTSYYRDLNIADAVATTRFTVDGVTYTREVFVSAPDQLIIVRLTASQRGKLTFVASTKSLLTHNVTTLGRRDLLLTGKAPTHTDPNYVNNPKNPVRYDDTTGCRGMRFALRIRALPSDGTVTADAAGLHVNNATEVVLLVSAATSFNGFDKCPSKDGKNEKLLVDTYLNAAVKKSYAQLKQTHLADYHTYFNRVSLTLNGSNDAGPDRLPTDQRLINYSAGVDDPALECLYYQFGRYLLISSSRPGRAGEPGTASTLQGIWNSYVRPPWSSNYTININTEMNYWAAEPGNLSEMHQPLFSLIGTVATTGRATARNFYGIGGWVAHHNTDIWATSNPVGDLGGGNPMWANWGLGGAWLCQHLYDHYRYTGDLPFLRDKAYPIMKGATEFCLAWLVKDKDGYWITSPSVTPENMFKTADGKDTEVSAATTMDMAIIRDLFTNMIEASTALHTDAALRTQLVAVRGKLYPFRVGKKGNLQEWYKDFAEADPQHRHVSHLFALHPGRQISPLLTPDLAAAARKTLEIRGDGGTGWSKAWKISFWARLNDGNHAYKLLRELMKVANDDVTDYANAGGTYPNLFCSCPPFQIDGNFGGVAGMNEMLLQSQLNEVWLLPALPDQWPGGQVRGLRARGGFEIVSLEWQAGKLTKLVIRSTLGGNCRIRVPNSLKASGAIAVKSASGANPNPFYGGDDVQPFRKTQVYDFPTQVGGVYTLVGL